MVQERSIRTSDYYTRRSCRIYIKNDTEKRRDTPFFKAGYNNTAPTEDTTSQEETTPEETPQEENHEE